MTIMLLWEFTSDGDDWDYSISCLSKPSKNKNKKANIFIKLKWFILILIWKFNNRKWTKCKYKTKALRKYKETLMKGYRL